MLIKGEAGPEVSSAQVKRVAIYARVSTTDQEPETQLRELRAYVGRRGWSLGDAHVFVDKGVSGSKDRRPQLDRLMLSARRRQIDAIVVWKFDRFARSVRHLVTALDEFRELSVDFVSVTEAIDTSTAMGRAMFTVVGAIAELERELIRERVRAGLARAKAEGRHVGRPRAQVDPDQVLSLRREGRSLRQIADVVGASKNVVARVLAGLGATA